MATLLSYGFVNLEHLALDRVTTVGTPVIMQAIQDTVAEYNRNINALMAAWVERTTAFQERYLIPGSGTLQPVDEAGHPLPITEAGHVDVGYPIQHGATAWGGNRISWPLMTIEEANRHTITSMMRDTDWLRRHLLAAIFDNVAWVYDDKLNGNLTVQPLANNDAVTYVRVGGASAVDNHYLAQAAAIADATNPFPTIYDELSEHIGFQGPVVVYVATSLVASIRALTNFVPVADSDIAPGMGVDTLRGSIDRGLGDRVIGKVDECWIIEWRYLPAGYMIAVDQGQGAFVAMREYPAAALQGFQPKQLSADPNLPTIEMYRDAGFGVRNRVGAVVYFVGGGAYAIPAGFDAPLAV
jgi:hypothetical protein